MQSRNTDLISNIFAWISLIVLVFMFMLVFPSFMANHSYYNDMLSNATNINLIISAFMFSIIPLVVLIYYKSITKFLIWLIIWLILFGYVYISSKSWWLIGSGFLMWPLNVLIVFVFIFVFLSFLLTFWRWLKIIIFGIKDNNLFWLISGFWLGLVFFLLLNYILILLNLYYSFINWIVFFSMIIVLFFLKDLFFDNIKILDQFINKSVNKITENKTLAVFYILLFIFSIMYFYFGFIMSWIPYPTAWDANHAYMFYPKMWALNNGFYWNEPNMNTVPYLWLGYIAFWFSLFNPFVDTFWINSDTFAVIMNFLSGIFVLIFSLAVLGNFVFKNEKREGIAIDMLFLVWWSIIIAWLTSWMGAFLVFVDNKTDLGVLALIILALYSGFLVFKYLYENKFELKAISGDSNLSFRLAIFSWLFFAVAVASKPTAFFDVVNFAIFMVFSVLSYSLAIAIFFGVIAFLTFIKMRGIVDYITFYGGKIISYLWVIFSILWTVELIYKFRTNFDKLKSIISIFVVWWLSFLIFLVLIKGLWVWMEIMYYDRYGSLIDVIKAILF